MFLHTTLNMEYQINILFYLLPLNLIYVFIQFLSHDIPLFEGIISDLFPSVELPKPDYDALETALIKHIEARNLQAVPYFIEKIIQVIYFLY